MDAKSPRKAGRKTFVHVLPPWIDPDAASFFITVCCQRRGTNQLCLPPIGEALLQSVRFYAEQRKWLPHVFLLMPDHFHMLVSFGYDHSMTKVMAAWKRYNSRQHGIVWQDGFFEHRLRRDESWEEKAAYVLNNPARAGLIQEGEPWPYVLRMDESGRAT